MVSLVITSSTIAQVKQRLEQKVQTLWPSWAPLGTEQKWKCIILTIVLRIFSHFDQCCLLCFVFYYYLVTKKPPLFWPPILVHSKILVNSQLFLLYLKLLKFSWGSTRVFTCALHYYFFKSHVLSSSFDHAWMIDEESLTVFKSCQLPGTIIPVWPGLNSYNVLSLLENFMQCHLEGVDQH